MRISKKQRKENAIRFYQSFINGYYYKTAIVINRIKSSNPNINRCQFLTVPSTLAFMEEPIVIAESVFGIDGCFKELLSFLKSDNIVKKSYFDDDFNEWLKENYNFEITYKDGLVFMLEKIQRR